MPTILPDIPATEAIVLDLTNKTRQREKLAAVKSNTALTIAARAFAEYLARTDTFSHTADGKQPSQRASGAGYQFCQIAENLAVSESERGFEAKTLATETLEGWLNSPGHRANLLAPNVTDIGVAVARVNVREPKYIVVQMFGRPRSMATEFQVSNATKEKVTYALSGHAHSIDPGTGIRHTICAPETIEFKSVGSKAFGGAYRTENGKVYTVTAKSGALAVDVKFKDTIQ
jgi:hypothetical protein